MVDENDIRAVIRLADGDPDRFTIRLNHHAHEWYVFPDDPDGEDTDKVYQALKAEYVAWTDADPRTYQACIVVDQLQ